MESLVKKRIAALARGSRVLCVVPAPLNWAVPPPLVSLIPLYWLHTGFVAHREIDTKIGKSATAPAGIAMFFKTLSKALRFVKLKLSLQALYKDSTSQHHEELNQT